MRGSDGYRTSVDISVIFRIQENKCHEVARTFEKYADIESRVRTSLSQYASEILTQMKTEDFYNSKLRDLKTEEVQKKMDEQLEPQGLQVKSVFPELSVADNLWITRQAGRRFLHPFRRAASDLETKSHVERILEQIGLSALAGRPAGTLSYGDVAMLEIGMAVISEPSLLLLDEPTCGMSPAETNRAVEKIRDLARTIDIVIIEHDMDVVFGIADDITVLAQGAILASGRPAEIAEDERVREAYLGRPEDEDFVEEAAHA